MQMPSPYSPHNARDPVRQIGYEFRLLCRAVAQPRTTKQILRNPNFRFDMTTTRSLASALLIGLIPFFIGCSSDKKTVTSANPWAGHAYLLNIPDKHWRQPKNIGGDLGPSVPGFLLDVRSGSGNTLDVLLGTSDANGVQDMCGPTTTIQATSQYPSIEIGPATARVRIGDKKHVQPVIATAYSLTMTDVLAQAADASVQDDSAFSAIIDAREIYSIFWQVPQTQESVCNTLESVTGAACTACPNDSLPYCLTLKAIGLAAGPLNGPALQPVEEANLAPSCATDGGP